MLESVSAKTFLKRLQSVSYFRFKNVKGDWDKWTKQCERLYKKHPEYTSTVNAKPWDKKAKKMIDNFSVYRKVGYNEHNSKIWKTTGMMPKLSLKWEDKIGTQLPLTNYIVTPTLQTPGHTLPIHVDKFFYLKRKTRSKWIVRFLIFMQPWQAGHYLLVNDHVIDKWKAGDCVVWHPNSEHIAANNGLVNKWTCNVTGVLDEKKLY